MKSTNSTSTGSTGSTGREPTERVTLVLSKVDDDALRVKAAEEGGLSLSFMVRRIIKKYLRDTA